jgi:hypothetical protein
MFLRRCNFRGSTAERPRLIPGEYVVLFTQDGGGAITVAQAINIPTLKARPEPRGQSCCAGQFAGSPLANPHLARLALEIGIKGKHPAQRRLGNLHFPRDSKDLARLMNCLSRD